MIEPYCAAHLHPGSSVFGGVSGEAFVKQKLVKLYKDYFHYQLSSSQVESILSGSYGKN